MANATFPARAENLEDVLNILGADQAPPEAELTGLDHHLQCAAVLAERYPDDTDLQIAGLLHDIGHYLAPGQPDLHGRLGAQYLRGLFGERVSALVELHVDAKRYLVSVEPEYRSTLSASSVRTLIVQGEAMSEDEIVQFEAHPEAYDAVALRRADEEAKVPSRQVPSLDAWLPILEAAISAGPAGTAAPATGEVRS